MCPEVVWSWVARYPEKFLLLMVWDLTAKQVQDPEKVTVHLRKGCPGCAKGTQFLSLCWAWPNPAKNSSAPLGDRDGLSEDTQKAPWLSQALTSQLYQFPL